MFFCDTKIPWCDDVTTPSNDDITVNDLVVMVTLEGESVKAASNVTLSEMILGLGRTEVC